jgi:hypothetical protein
MPVRRSLLRWSPPALAVRIAATVHRGIAVWRAVRQGERAELLLRTGPPSA